MKQPLLKSLILLTIIGFASLAATAQSFEGTIEFKKKTTADTTKYIYYVKGDKIRIDEIGAKSGKPEGTFLVDTKESKMISLSHERKIFMDKSQGAPPIINGKPAVSKTKNTKTIQGYKCTEYVVKNTEENTKISYWVASDKFDFFPRLLKLLNRKDKFSTYYQQLNDVDGMFPFLAVESPMDGKEKGRLEVTKIEKKPMEASLFEIPKDYKKFE